MSEPTGTKSMTPARTSADPWAHRSLTMRCHTCLWFVAKGEATAENRVGRCRKRAPTMDGYPVVFQMDWCGDHKLDETKV